MHTLLHWLPVWCTNPAKTFAKAHIYSIYAYNTYKQALEAYTHTHTFSYCCTCAPSNPCKICCKCLKHTHIHTLQVCNIGIIGTTLESLEHWNHFLEKCTPRPTPCRSVTARHTDPPKVMMYPHVYNAAKTLRLLHTLPLITQGVERGQGCTLRLRSAPAPLRSGLSKK